MYPTSLRWMVDAVGRNIVLKIDSSLLSSYVASFATTRGLIIASAIVWHVKVQ